MEPIQFLDSVAGYVRTGSESSADKPIRLARIDPAYSPFGGSYPNGIDPARVTFEGETVLSGKAYPVAAGYVPTPNARVYMVPIGTTYLIAGGAAQYAAQGFYAESDGTLSGIEFGGGNYFDTDVGLVLDTDADFGGDVHADGFLTTGPRNIRVPEIRTGTVTMSTASAVSAIQSTINLSPAFPTGSSLVLGTPNINSIASNSAGVYARTDSVTLSSFRITLLQADLGRSSGNIPAGFSASVHWVVFGYPPAGA